MIPQSNISCRNCPNVNCFIKSCSPDWIQLISNKKSESKYKKGQHIFIASKPIFGIYFIKTGKIKISSDGWNGKEQIVRLATDGHILGHRGYGKETYPISAAALDESVICFVENHIIYETFMENPGFTYIMMMFYAQELRAVEARIKDMAQMTTTEKVASALLYLKEVFGYTNGDVLNVNISRKEIAALAGISEEQTVRSLTDLENKKLIAKMKRNIRILNEEMLQKTISLYR